MDVGRRYMYDLDLFKSTRTGKRNTRTDAVLIVTLEYTSMRLFKKSSILGMEDGKERLSTLLWSFPVLLAPHG